MDHGGYRTVKYKRCRSCEFHVTVADSHCPNCGVADPRSSPDVSSETLTLDFPMTDGARAAFGGFLGAVVGGFLMAGMGVAVGIAVGISLGVLLGADRDWTARTPREAVPVGLVRIEERIRERLEDLGRREERLGDSRRLVERQQTATAAPDEPGIQNWERVRARIDDALGLVRRQRERYHAKLWEIALVRWQNRLDPLAADWESLDHDECAKRLERLDTVQEEGRHYLGQWEGVDLTELPEAQRCLDRLRAALGSCDRLREQLVVQQATLALRGVAPVDETLAAPTAPDLGALDSFNARASLGEFSSAFDELEHEYERLQADQEFAERADMVRRLGRPS